MNGSLRRIGLVTLLGAATLAGGCAVYGSPTDVGVAVVPPPVVVAPPPVIVRPYGYWGGYPGAYGYGGYHRPPYYAPRYGPPRYSAPPRFYRR